MMVSQADPWWMEWAECPLRMSWTRRSGSTSLSIPSNWRRYTHSWYSKQKKTFLRLCKFELFRSFRWTSKIPGPRWKGTWTQLEWSAISRRVCPVWPTGSLDQLTQCWIPVARLDSMFRPRRSFAGGTRNWSWSAGYWTMQGLDISRINDQIFLREY